MALINCKVELKLKWRKHCVLSVATADNAKNRDSNNINFTIKDTKLYVPVVTSARDNQKRPKLLSKGFEKSVYWNEYKPKNENKDTTYKNVYFLESTFVGVSRLCFSLYI